MKRYEPKDPDNDLDRIFKSLGQKKRFTPEIAIAIVENTVAPVVESLLSLEEDELRQACIGSPYWLYSFSKGIKDDWKEVRINIRNIDDPTLEVVLFAFWHKGYYYLTFDYNQILPEYPQGVVPPEPTLDGMEVDGGGKIVEDNENGIIGFIVYPSKLRYNFLYLKITNNLSGLGYCNFALDNDTMYLYVSGSNSPFREAEDMSPETHARMLDAGNQFFTTGELNKPYFLRHDIGKNFFRKYRDALKTIEFIFLRR